MAKALAPQEGYTLTPLPDVRFLRSNRPLFVIVCQGRKRGFWADQVCLYDTQHYLAVSVPYRSRWRPMQRKKSLCWRSIWDSISPSWAPSPWSSTN